MPRLPVSSASGPIVTLHGRRVVSFGGCNYLGLSYHPQVHRAMILALEQFGVSTSASRETTGNTILHDRLEAAVCEFLGVEAAVVVPDGYTANLAAAQALGGTYRAAVIDSRCHRSIREAITCAGMKSTDYEHLNAADASARIKQHGAPVTVWTDGVFASDGTVAPLPALLKACRDTNSLLIVDDCHGLCTMGPSGRGTLSHFGLSHDNVIITSTLAKGLGCHGGFVAGRHAFCDVVRTQSTAYICTTPTSPAIAAAAIEAFSIVRGSSALVQRLTSNAALLAQGLTRAGVDITNHTTPIFAFTLPASRSMQKLHEHLLQLGFLAPLITYPDGPAPCYFRLSITSGHTPEQIESLCEAIERWMKEPDRPTPRAEPASASRG